MKLLPTFPVPNRMPNGLQWTDEGLMVMDQYSDNVYVLDSEGNVARTITTPTENGSGITVGGGYLWTASNGKASARPFRPTDTHTSWVYKLDMKTGDPVQRFPLEEAFTVLRTLPSELNVLHGLARVADGIWCADWKAKVIVKFDVDTGKELDRVTFPEDGPDPHGLSIRDGELWYCDAAFPQPTSRDYPEIGKIVL